MKSYILLIILATYSTSCFSPELSNSEKSKDLALTIGSTALTSGSTIVAPCGGEIAFGASGVIGSTTYSVLSGSGTFSDSGTYTAPASEGEDQIRISDSTGSSIDLTISVVNATNTGSVLVNVQTGSSHTFSVVDGLSYTAAGTGAFDSSTGVYTAPSTATTDTLTLTTSGGTFSITVNVYDPLTASAQSFPVALNTGTTINSSGGVPPYSYSVSYGDGTVTSAGVFSSSTTGHSKVMVTDSIGNTAVELVRTKRCDLADSWETVEVLANGAEDIKPLGVFQDPIDGEIYAITNRTADNQTLNIEVRHFTGGAFAVVATHTIVFTAVGGQVDPRMDSAGGIWIPHEGVIGGAEDFRIAYRPRGGSFSTVYDHDMTGVTDMQLHDATTLGTDLWMLLETDYSGGANPTNTSERYSIYRYASSALTLVSEGYVPALRSSSVGCESYNTTTANCDVSTASIIKGPDNKIWASIAQEETDGAADDYFHGFVMHGDQNGMSLAYNLHDTASSFDQLYYAAAPPGFDDLGNFYVTYHKDETNGAPWYSWQVYKGTLANKSALTDTNIDTTVISDTSIDTAENQTVNNYVYHPSSGQIFVGGRIKQVGGAVKALIRKRGVSGVFTNSDVFQQSGSTTGHPRMLAIDSSENLWASLRHVGTKNETVIRKLSCN